MENADKIFPEKMLLPLIGEKKLKAWADICSQIESLYDMDKTWSDGGKKWTYEYKYRRGGKTLCALYAKENTVGFMIIFGKAEREKVSSIAEQLSVYTQDTYDAAQTYHDGKWVMFDERIPLCDIKLLLSIKRKPNRKE